MIEFKDIHSQIRILECKQDWYAQYSSIEERLKSTWNIQDWFCLISCYDFLGYYDRMREQLNTVQEERLLNDNEVFALKWYMWGRLNQSLGEYGLALNQYAQSVAHGAGIYTLGLMKLQTGTINYFLGDYKNAFMEIEKTAQIAIDEDDPFVSAHAFDFLTVISVKRGDYSSAWEFLKKGRKMATLANNPHRLTWLDFSEGQLRCAIGEKDIGIKIMMDVKSAFEKNQALNCIVPPTVAIAEELIEIGRVDDALELLIKAEEGSRVLRFNLVRARIFEALSKVYPDVLKRTKYRQRSEVLRKRAKRIFPTGDGIGLPISRQEIIQLLETIDADAFEILCSKILESYGMHCNLTPLDYPDIDIIAIQDFMVGTGRREQTKWAVQCKRWFSKNVSLHGLPNSGMIKIKECSGLIIMTTAKLTPDADRVLEEYSNEGIRIETWTIDRIVSFLQEEHWILSEVLGI